MLIGVVFEDGRFRAWFENLRGQPTTRAVVGDPIANGIVEQVYLDAIAYLVDGEIIWVDIGQDLTGSTPRLPSGSSSADGSGNDADAPPGNQTRQNNASGPADASGGDGNLSIEQRLRLRRQQESGGR